ncbi:MFS transporter [Arthrobacter silvisoli]|uniref:MFS transporter n=1 Tax=Arthrobacter silvisoli TaxID=2291022 RepID=UPI000E218E94|nr:MFS transporter [Arthrobacter silvisoli]
MGLLIDLRPLRASRRFSVLWSTGVLMSVTGQFLQVALAWKIYDITHSPLMVGLLGVAVGVPTVIFGLLGGSYADTRRPKVIGLIGSIGQFLVLLAAAGCFLVVGDPTESTVWVIYLVVVLQITCGTFSAPTRRPYLRHLLGRELLPSASSLYMLSMHIGMILGPFLGGVLIGTVTLGVVLILAAAAAGAYLLAVFFLPDIPAGQVGTGVKHAFIEGLVAVVRSKPLRGAFLLDLCVTVIALPTALLPALNAEILGGGPAEYGLLVAGMSIGGLLATLLSGPITSAKRPGHVLVVAAAAWVGAILLLAWAPNFATALTVLALVGALDTVAMTSQSIILQMAVPDNLLGRVSSFQSVAGMAGPQLGNIRGGLLGTLFGPSAGIAAGAAAGLVAVGFAAWTHPDIRKFVVSKAKEIEGSNV